VSRHDMRSQDPGGSGDPDRSDAAPVVPGGEPAREAQQSGEERFKSLFDQSLVGLYRTTPDGEILLANPALCRMLGYASFDELSRRNLEREGYQPGYPRSEFKKRIERDGFVHGLHSSWRSREGSPRFVRESATMVRDPDGRPLYYEGTVEDVSDWKEVQDQLSRSRRRLEHLAAGTARLLAAEDPRSLLSALGAEMMTQLECDVFLNCLIEPDSGAFRINAWAGIPDEEIQRTECARLDATISGRVSSSGMRFVAEDILHSTDPFLDVVRRAGLQAYACHPLWSENRVMGSLAFGTTTRPRFSPDELALMKSMAEQVGVALDRANARVALRASEVRYRRLYESLHDAFVAVDMPGHILEFNDTFVKLTGYDAGELPALTYRDLTPLRWHDAEARIVEEQVLSRGYSEVYEKEYRRKDGTIIPVELRTILLRDAAGAPSGMWAIVRDITARRQAESALERSEERLRELILSLPVGVVVHAPDTTVRLANPAALAMLGVTEEEAQRRTLEDAAWRFIREDGSPLSPPEYPLSVVLATGTPVHGMVVGIRDPGTDGFHWGLVDGFPTFGETGEIREVMIVFTDITELKRAESALEDSERKFSLAFDGSPLAISLTNRRTQRYVEVNRAFAETMGYSREDVVGRTRQELNLFAAEQLEEVGRLMHRDGRVQGLDFDCRTKNGQHRILRVFAGIIEFAGEPHVLATSEDVTELKRAEAALQESEGKFSIAFDCSPLMKAIATIAEGRFLAVNRAFEKFTGYARDELIGRTRSEVRLWDSREELERAAHAVREQGGFSGMKVACRTKSGVVRPVRMSAATIDVSGLPCLLTVAEDVSELERAEAELRELNAGLERRVLERTAELARVNASLQARSEEVEAFNRLMLGREHRVIEMKEEVNRLCVELGRPPVYEPVWSPPPEPGSAR
jgi:PAS domain S-box-containing protein